MTFDQMVAAIGRGFSMLSDYRRGRATHTHGVAARGSLVVTQNPQFPQNPLLKAGAKLDVVLRHGSVKGLRDDAIWDARGAALRILPDLEPGQGSHDILMNTGEVFPTGTASAFFQWFAASQAQRAQMVTADPTLAAAIADALRDADTFINLRYHSQVSFRFEDPNGQDMYVRYRLVPADDRPETGFVDPTKLEPGMDYVPRQFGDFRSTHFLRDDFRHRVRNGGVRYRLELQLHVILGDNDALDCSRVWDPDVYPWMPVGEIVLDQIVPDEVAEKLRFSPGNTHKSLAWIPSEDPDDPASLNALRILVYQQASAWRNRKPSTDPKQKFVYDGQAGVDLPILGKMTPLPPSAYPTMKFQARAGMFRLVEPHPASPPEPAVGIMGVRELMGAKLVKWMPANFTRLRDDKFSDAFFCSRRLNGFNAGKLNHVVGRPWDYETNFKTQAFKKDPGGLLPDRISARFSHNGDRLHPHSIVCSLDGTVAVVRPTHGSDWEFAKKQFRCTEYVFTQAQTHLARCHLNVEQYAMAAFRNFANSPLIELLRPHLEGTMYINKLGSGLIAGPDGIIAVASPLDSTAVDAYLVEEVKNLTWRWQPSQIALPDYIEDNHFDPAAQAMWSVVKAYVHDYFETHLAGIEAAWSEVEAFSEDLVAHSILRPELGTLAVNDLADLRQLCTYVIYIATFAHSWTNGKVWEDGADPEYATFGMWDQDHPEVHPARLAQIDAAQVNLTYQLAQVHYNPIMEVGPPMLRKLLGRARRAIDPGLPLGAIMMSINV